MATREVKQRGRGERHAPPSQTVQEASCGRRGSDRS